jgi:large subunit ribosomal protein L15
MPLTRRIPKRGFTNIFRIELTIVNLDRLAKLRKVEIRPKDMADHGLIKKESERVKILGRGDLTSAKTIHAHQFSESAVKKIEAMGGQAVVIGKDPC